MHARLRPTLCLAAALLAGTSLLAAAQLSKPLQFKGRFFGIEAQFKLRVDSFSTPEEIARIKEPLIRQDYENFYKTLWTMDKGLLQFIGVSRTNVHFNLAVEEKTEKGRRLLLIADSKSVMNTPVPTEWGLRPFYIVELVLDEKDQGEGRIHAAALLDFPATGGVTMKSYRSDPQMLVNVRLLK
jgi:hypothetical protein